MGAMIRALSGNPNRTEALRDWMTMYAATVLVASVVILFDR